MSQIIMQTVTLFIILLIGLMCQRLGWLTRQMRTGLSNVLLHIATPCVIVQAFQHEASSEVWRNMGVCALITICVMLASVFVCRLVFHKEHGARRSVLVYAASFGNMGYMAIPVIGAFVGEEGIIYVSVGIAVFNFLCWTLGVSIFDKKAANLKKLLTFPCLYAVAFGLCMFATGFKMPALLDSATDMIAGITSPFSMMMIGCIIGDSSFRGFFRDKGSLLAIFIRLVCVPAVVVGVCTLLGIDPHLRTVLVLLNGMPTAVNTALLSVLFHSDEELGSRLVAVSTLLYLPAVFLWMLVLGG